MRRLLPWWNLASCLAQDMVYNVGTGLRVGAMTLDFDVIIFGDFKLKMLTIYDWISIGFQELVTSACESRRLITPQPKHMQYIICVEVARQRRPFNPENIRYSMDGQTNIRIRSRTIIKLRWLISNMIWTWTDGMDGRPGRALSTTDCVHLLFVMLSLSSHPCRLAISNLILILYACYIFCVNENIILIQYCKWYAFNLLLLIDNGWRSLYQGRHYAIYG